MKEKKRKCEHVRFVDIDAKQRTLCHRQFFFQKEHRLQTRSNDFFLSLHHSPPKEKENRMCECSSQLKGQASRNKRESVGSYARTPPHLLLTAHFITPLQYESKVLLVITTLLLFARASALPLLETLGSNDQLDEPTMASGPQHHHNHKVRLIVNNLTATSSRTKNQKMETNAK